MDSFSSCLAMVKSSPFARLLNTTWDFIRYVEPFGLPLYFTNKLTSLHNKLHLGRDTGHE